MMRTVRSCRQPKRAIWRSAFRTVFVVLAATLVWRTGTVPGTNAFFSDSARINGNSVSAGMWIPVLSVDSVVPVAPNGTNGFYNTRPCVKLSYEGLSFGAATIWYEFSDDGDPKAGGTEYELGACIDIPDGNPTNFQAVAIHDMNHDWRSAVVSRDFKVDTQCPVVTLHEPDDGAVFDGMENVDIRVSLSDEYPDHYWLVIQKDGKTVAGQNTVKDADELDDETVYTWNISNATKFPDGNYVIKFEARDQANNKCDKAGVSGSIDWNTVTIDRPDPETPSVPFVLANLAVPMIDTTSSDVTGEESIAVIDGRIGTGSPEVREPFDGAGEADAGESDSVTDEPVASDGDAISEVDGGAG